MAFLQNIFKPNLNRILTSALPVSTSILNIQNDIFTIQKRFAARKYKRIERTRQKQKQAKVKREQERLLPPKVWKPSNLLVDKKLRVVLKKFNDDDRRGLDEIVDDVYIVNHYKEQKHSFEETMALIRETHDPTMYDEPDALIQAKIELDLRTKRKTKFIERFKGIISYPNPFSYGVKRKIIAICKTQEDEELAKKAGADISGSRDLIQMLKSGEILMENFDDLVCHGEMLIELATIKSSLGLHFPTKQRGNIGFDITRLVSHFVNGHEYSLSKDNIEPDYGYVCIPFGRLSQTNEELRKNFQTLLESVDGNRPDDVKFDFITRVLLYSEPCPELFPVTFWECCNNYNNRYEEEEEEENSDKIVLKN